MTRSLFACTVIALSSLVACGGASPPPSAPTTEAAPATKAAAPTPPTATPTTTTSATASVDIAGKWCGRLVTDPKACKGDDVGFLEVSVIGEAASGQFCEAFNKDCMLLEASTFKGDALAFAYKFKQGSGKATCKLAGDSLSCELKVTKKEEKATSMTFHRIK